MEKQKIEPLSKWSKQWLEEVVPYIITSAEKDVFVSLPTEAERGKFIENFWQKRDPNPATPENEFKIEYYRRIALANKLFGASGLEGWRTDRGKLYILLGPPNEIQRDMKPYDSSGLVFHGPKETWNYWNLPNPRLPYNLEFVFVDRFGIGNYILEQSLKLEEGGSSSFDMNSLHYYFDYVENITEAMRNPFESGNELKGIITTQVDYNLVPLKYDLYYMKGGAEKRTYVPLVIEIPYATLTPKEIEDKYYFSLALMINVSNNLGQIVFEKSKDINFKHLLTEMNSLKDTMYQLQASFVLEPGDYKIHLLVLDSFSGKIGTLHKDISVPMFSSTELSLSDIILSFKKDEAGERKIGSRESDLREPKIFPEVSRVFRLGEELNIYFEIYNLSLDKATGRNNFRVEYNFFQNEKLLVHIPSPDQKSTSEKDCLVETSFRLKDFKPGDYIFQAKVIDANLAKTVHKEIPFAVRQ